MIGCTRCGRWHDDAEAAEGKRLTCTEVKQYWINIRNEHNDRYGHYASIGNDDDGAWICLKCERKI